MEGRWAFLAVRAHRTGALDYSKITREDDASLYKEALILADIEKETYSRFFLELSKITPDANKAGMFFKDALGLEMPWEGETINKPEIQRLTELYEAHANKEEG